MPTLAEQVAALEAERDYWRKSYEMADGRAALNQRERLAAESRLAQSEADAKKAIGHADWLRKKYEDCRADLAVAESRLASARVEGAREAVETIIEFVRTWRGFDVDVAGDCGPSTGNVLLREMRKFRDREYPAPAAPAGEQTRPATTPEPPKVTLLGGYKLVESEDVPPDEVWLYDENRKRVVVRVALGSRPTQTAEG